MEEEKAAEYYNELVRKGEGAARFKQGLGFSSTTTKHNVVPARGSALPSSSASSFLSSFVKASSPTKARSHKAHLKHTNLLGFREIQIGTEIGIPGAEFGAQRSVAPGIGIDRRAEIGI
ncbi:hypothetical protein CsSME_00006857 [Camellia sinensis var. sinensis]